MKRLFRRAFSILCIILLGISVVPVSGASDVPLKDKYTYGSAKGAMTEYTRLMKCPYYALVLAEYDKNGFKSAAAKPILIDAINIKLSNGSAMQTQTDIGGKKNPVFIWNESNSNVEWEFEIMSEGLYQIEMEYYMPEGSGNPAVRSLMVDGETPFIEAGNIVFPRMWKDNGEPVINSIGDETRPGQVEITGWRSIKLTDGSGFYAQPLKFYFKPGKHSLRFDYVDQKMAVSSLRIVPSEELPTYEKVKEQYRVNGYSEASNTVEFEAESTAVEKSDPTIRRETHGDPVVRPESGTSRKLNVIGGYRWRRGNQSITWNFSVPVDGLYKIGVKELQSWNDGLPSFRQIAIDGQVPFKELNEYSFSYDKKWKTEVLRDKNDEPFLFYLSKGEHTITMAVKMGSLTSVIQSLNDDTILLSNMLRDIIKVTGSNPDPNYDYDFFDTIPDLKSNMELLMDSLQMKYDMVKGMSLKVPAMANNFLTIKTQLAGMVKNPFNIARRMNDLNSAQTSLGSWYLSLQNQPLMIDYIKVGAPKERWKDDHSSIFKKLKATLANFMVSFKKDYDNVGGVLDDDTRIKSTINVWIARGTEWAELIKEMADEDFTPNTGIKVNINVLPASQLEAGNVNALMLAVTSGRAPDVGLGVDSSSPVDFAIRDAVLDLSKFKDFEEVSNRFIKNIMIPYQYRKGVYALPETMDFSAMFYRKDIIEELDLQLPDTKEELYGYVLPALYQNGLQFYYPQDFTQFIFQQGGDYYTSDGKKSSLDTPEAFRAFQEYTELYTSYGIPVSASFFNRMRSGEMPIGIGGYGLYMQLSVAAPELAGRWGIAPLPGTKRADGTVDRSNGALAGGCDIIMKQTKHPEESWEFLKWWSSTQVQTRFARELEALIGAEARWNTANVEAFTSLAWNKDDIKVIKEQWKWAKETPVVLGGYFTGRYLGNAWNSVVIGGANLRDSLETAVREINRELRMKQEEYGVYDSQR